MVFESNALLLLIDLDVWHGIFWTPSSGAVSDVA